MGQDKADNICLVVAWILLAFFSRTKIFSELTVWIWIWSPKYFVS